jgi:hypothetical protein
MRKAIREGLVTRRGWNIYFEGSRLCRYRWMAARLLKEDDRGAASPNPR